jgi:hypothetical protein
MSSRRHRRRGGSRGEPGLITNQLDSREGVNARKKILPRERPLPRTRIQSLNFALTHGPDGDTKSSDLSQEIPVPIIKQICWFVIIDIDFYV